MKNLIIDTPITETKVAREKTIYSQELQKHLAYLAIVEGGDTGTFIVLNKINTLVGRGASQCDIIVDDDLVSRRHMVISYKKGKYFFQDLNSRNGLLVNGSFEVRGALKHGDKITLGDTVFQFLTDHGIN